VAHAQNWADNIGAVHPEAKNFLDTAFIKEHVESAAGDHFFTSSERARMQKFTENTDRYVGEVDAFCKQAAALNHKNNPFKVLRGAASCLEPAFYSRFNLSALQESTTHVFSSVSYGIFNFFNKHIDLYELRSFPVVLPPRPMTLASAETDFDFISALVEQDSVANLRYGVLFLLALSSLGVYSIILAG